MADMHHHHHLAHAKLISEYVTV